MQHFPMYIDDFRGGVSRLSLEEIGAYSLLLLEIYDQGGRISADLREVAYVLRCDIRVAKRLVGSLTARGKLQESEGYLTNLKATSVLCALHKRSEQARSAIEKRWKINGHAHTDEHTDVILSKTKTKTKEKNAREARWPFDEFWEAYPHKIGKGQAEKAFRKVEKSDEVDFLILMTALLTYREKTDDRPWCNPATWLNQKRWLDRPATQKREGWRGAIL